MAGGPSKRAKILRRTWTGGGLALVAGLLIWLADSMGSPLPVLAVAGAIGAAATWELARMGALASGPRTVGLAVGTAVALIGTWAGLSGDLPRGLAGGATVAVATGALALVAHSATGGRSASRVVTTGAMALWVAPPMPLLAWFYLDHGTGGLIALIVLSKIGDIAGYYGGSAFGRHHPFPKLSPGKTTEGCLASLLGGAVTGALFGLAGWFPVAQFDLAPAIVGAILGAVINVAAQAGDLLESLAKRRSGVKDSSGLLGASGGFLDVVDSLLLTVPVGLLAWGFAFGANSI